MKSFIVPSIFSKGITYYFLKDEVIGSVQPFKCQTTKGCSRGDIKADISFLLVGPVKQTSRKNQKFQRENMLYALAKTYQVFCYNIDLPNSLEDSIKQRFSRSHLSH